MSLPYLLSYEDSKIEKAYHRYLEGESQKKIAKALKIPERTLARRCIEGGWEDERKIRRTVADETPVVAAVAVEQTSATATESAPLPEPTPKHGPEPDVPQENQRHAIDRMLRKQQRFVDRLVDAADRASEELIASIEGKPARVAFAQVSQLSTLGGRLLEMQRKAYRVPDKMEIEDTTPAQKHIDNVRRLREEREVRERGAVAAATAVPPPVVH